jgi:tripartite-type tricarboxylate transporter receptor subunit TctC
MRFPRRQFLHLAAVAAALPVFPDIARAQSYPSRPVRVIVPYSPGGPTDVCARFIAQGLSEALGKQFYVENIAGAGGNIGTGQAARTTPDGYSILITVNSYVINPTLYDRVPYHALRDFEAVTLAAIFPSAMLVNPSVPATTVKELVARSSSRTPANTASPHRASVRRRTSSANNSVSCWASTSSMCPMAAAARP